MYAGPSGGLFDEGTDAGAGSRLVGMRRVCCGCQQKLDTVVKQNIQEEFTLRMHQPVLCRFASNELPLN